VGLAVRARAQLRSSRNRHVLLILGTFAVLLLALGLVAPIFVLRYFIVLFPVALIGLAILAGAAFPISKSWLAVLPMVFFTRAAVVDFRFVDGMQRQEWDASVDLVLASLEADDPVYILATDPDRPMLDYLEAGDVDGAVYRQNLRYYAYYFRRRGAADVAARLEWMEPTVQQVQALADRYRESGRTVHILAGHHIQLDEESVWTLEQAARRVETTWLYSTIVYQVAF
jgi:hypothetical protein